MCVLCGMSSDFVPFLYLGGLLCCHIGCPSPQDGVWVWMGIGRSFGCDIRSHVGHDS